MNYTLFAMNIVQTYPFWALILLVITAEICGKVLKIRSDVFYSPFHFLAGALTSIILFNLIGNKVLSVALTAVVGILWEVYERLEWKYFIKKKSWKPTKKDIISDLILDFLGAILALTLI